MNIIKINRNIFVLLIFMSLLCGVTVFAADPQQGGKLYVKKCQNCHGSTGLSDLPGLPDFSRSQGLLKSDNDLLNFIRAGQGMMPAFRGLLTDREILDVIAYLRTLHR